LIPPEVASRMRRFVLEPTELPPMRAPAKGKSATRSRGGNAKPDDEA
jgi:hypothetical protein